MNRASLADGLCLARRSPLVRWLLLVGLLAVGLATARAQKAVTTLAGTAGASGFVDATGSDARFRVATPSGAAVDASGNVYVADTSNHAIRRVSPTGVVTTFAGSTGGVSGSADGVGTAARFNSPAGVAIDGAGNLYVADTGNHAIRMVAPDGTVTTLAGTAGAGITVTDGYVNASGTAARFRSPAGVATDRAGAGNSATKVYVADSQNNAIRQVVVATGAVTTLAGSDPAAGGGAGSSGFVNGTAAESRFSQPQGIAAFTNGSVLYVADTGNHAVRRILIADGVAEVSTHSGSGAAGYAEGAGASAAFSAPGGIALDIGGAVLVSDTMNHVVRTVTTSAATPLAGTPTVAGSSDGMAIGAARFNRPTGLAVDAVNNVYVIDSLNGTVRKISNATAPAISTHPTALTVELGQSATFTAAASGNPAPQFQWQRLRAGESAFSNLVNGDQYSGATSATLTIASTAVIMSGDQYRVVVSNGVSSVTSDAALLTLTPGTVYSTWIGQPGVSGAVDATGTAARLRHPTSIVVDADGNAYIADAANHTIRRVSSTGVVTTLAGLAGVSGSADGFQAAARFNTPSGIALDSGGNLYVADTGSHTIRRVTIAGSVTTLAGTAGMMGSVDDTGAAARFSFPSDVAVDSAGAVYVADTVNHSVRKIVNGVVTTVVPASEGILFPGGIAVDAAFNLYVSDSRKNVIRKVTPGGAVSILAGSVLNSGSANGTGADARFNNPQGLTVDSSGNVYVADTGNQTIRRITAAGEVTTIAGVAGTSGATEGPGNQARFNGPNDVALDVLGNIYVADTQNHTIRRTGAGTAPAIASQPMNQTAAVGGAASFTVAATGSPTPAFQWQRQPAGTTGFTSLTNSATYSGVHSATMVVTGATPAMSGDQFRAVATNLVGSPATSSAATLTVLTPPVFTSPSAASFRVGEAGTFTLAAASNPAPTFSATGLPSWATLNATTGVISGTPPETSGSPFTVVVTANNSTSTSTAVTQNLTLTVLPANVPAGITTQPVASTVNRGQTVTLSVGATGTGALSYQWFKDGVAIAGATSPTLVLPNAQAATAGLYTVAVSNAFGSSTSTPVAVGVNTPPEIVTPPRAQTVLAGGTVTFSVAATGGAGLTYQWRKNGVAIAGATSAALTISSVSAADAGTYDVVLTNALGSTTSSVAQLIVATGSVAPTFTAQPGNRTAGVGSNVTLTAAAMGVPAPTFQWRRNGAPILGATGTSLALPNIQVADTANYDVVISNSAGTATSQSATVRVIARSYAGTYFASLVGGLGNVALFVREDNTGVFLGYLPGAIAAVVNANLMVSETGQFSFAQVTTPGYAGVTVSGSIANDGTVTGVVTGSVNASFSGTRSAVVGVSEALAGYYQAGASGSASVGYVIASATGQAFAVVQTGGVTDGGVGVVSSGGAITIATGRSSITGSIVPAAGALVLTASGGVTAALTGASEAVLATQRLANISSRARVMGSTSLAIAGFVVTGTESKPVLIRAVGPSLAVFGITGALATPSLQLFRGDTPIAVNTGINTSADAAAIAAAARRAGAFELGSSGADSALLVTLPPGTYTAQVSGTNNAEGIVLVEVYDLSAPAIAQKLLNISTRAFAGTGIDVLTAGIVVTGSAPKRVLIRGVGPGLTQFGLTGVLPTPTLSLIRGGQTLATNTGWSTSADAVAITAAGAQVGAFPLTAGDAAMIVTLSPGDYSAQVTGAAGATGTAIIEVYELP